MAEEDNKKISVKLEQIIDGSTLLDDNLMTLVFNGNVEAAQLVLSIILDRKDLIVRHVEAQKLEKNPLFNGRDVKIDVFADDAEGNYYDIEIQRADEGAGVKRARFLSSALDHSMLEHSQDFDKIKDSYIIFITQNDVLKGGLPLYHSERHWIELDKYVNGGSHIIYANASYHDNSSEIGKLMHDFRCRNSEDMFFKPLRDSVHHFKETEGGRARMSKDIEQYAEERAITTVLDIAKTENWSEEKLRNYLKDNFNLTKEDVEKYVEPVYA